MKKLAVAAIGIALGASILSFTGVSTVQAQTVDVSQFKQVIELFIALGIIAPDKVDQVRLAFGITVPVAVSTSTPIFGVSGSNVSSSNLGSVVQQDTPISPVPAVTITAPYCIEKTYKQGTYLANGVAGKILDVSFDPKQYAPKIDINVNVPYTIADVVTEGYVSQNDSPVLSQPRVQAGAGINSETPYYIYTQNVAGIYPLHIKVYTDAYRKNLITSYDGEVTINQACN